MINKTLLQLSENLSLYEDVVGELANGQTIRLVSFTKTLRSFKER